ncbi:hypothetical protein P171DRAFT_427454 [Karstenula rhodostoma CBS 690.94]|uniref:Uncharacterized protein n=1 Tax=Karstenula rhodostoma CBS 690.94 TaxID=1392251 RepID=A0A9P4UHF4_9PLEO|nr:hypothetical protein P171DRAFT_427454 [Karstenula rhodostoma CBS 690.94]
MSSKVTRGATNKCGISSSVVLVSLLTRTLGLFNTTHLQLDLIIMRRRALAQNTCQFGYRREKSQPFTSRVPLFASTGTELKVRGRLAER